MLILNLNNFSFLLLKFSLYSYECYILSLVSCLNICKFCVLIGNISFQPTVFGFCACASIDLNFSS